MLGKLSDAQRHPKTAKWASFSCHSAGAEHILELSAAGKKISIYLDGLPCLEPW